MTHDVAGSALAHKPKPRTMPKPPKEFHAKKLESGGYLATKSHGDKPDTQHGAKNMAELKQMLQEHMGAPQDQEQDQEPTDPQADPSQGDPSQGGADAAY